MRRYATRALLAFIATSILVACTSVAAVPTAVPSVAAPTVVATVAAVAPNATLDTLSAQLRADDIAVTAITLEGTPPTLTVAYTLSDQRIASGPNIETGIAVEEERSVHTLTRRIVALLDAGVPIGRVILRDQVGSVPSQPRLIQIADMRGWVSGQIDDHTYAARWCCTAP